MFAVHFYLRGAAFVVQAAGLDGAARDRDALVRDRRSPPRICRRSHGAAARCARARYRPAHATGRPILLVPGVHAAGIDEPRLVGFARDIAAIGHPVVTVELPDLTQYRITPARPT